MEILLYVAFIIGCAIGLIGYTLITKPAKENIIKAFIIAVIWTLFGLLWDFLGINIYHLWDNTVSLLPELWNIPIGNIPFCIFGGMLFVLIWDEFETPITQGAFLLTATGTCGYGVVLLKEQGFLLHFEPYNSGWAYLFWLSQLLMMVVMDYLYKKYFLKTSS